MASTDHSQHGHGGHHGTPGGIVLNHEPTDVSLKGVTRIAILSFAVIFAILAMVYGIWRGFEYWAADKRELPPLSAYTPGKDRLPPAPLIITDEPGTLRQLRTEEKQILEHYSWVDKNQGIVRVPIERAIDLLVEQPDRITPAGAAPIVAPPADGAAAPAPAAAGH